MTGNVRSWSVWFARIRLASSWRCERGSCCWLATAGTTCRLRGNWVSMTRRPVTGFRRWLEFAEVPLEDLRVAKRLADAPKPGAPPKFTPEQICQIIALACEKPTDCERPISHWSHSELADEIMRRGIVQSISPRHAGRLLKRGRSQAAPDSVPADAPRRRAARRAR